MHSSDDKSRSHWLVSFPKAKDRFSIYTVTIRRGPLGAVAVNKRIKETLEDDTKRELFHLLNNGLAAVCRGI